ncbi:Dehydrodolichyl diphosphate synthase complex subunit NUS1 [Nakaseomyces bracarensis]|uniref:ditrans,polycis-polyprenyl diphosphate synthase [(2E,6E)-farnesyldiphosphate specific] n=1 Tax=Nakaseomyces bracarensis TaxID=273131 RepID=A0ABR4NW29_9SACH
MTKESTLAQIEEISRMAHKNETDGKLRSLKASDIPRPMETDDIKYLKQKEDWNHKMGKLEFIFYKAILITLYIMYGMYRFCQFRYNRLKLSILTIINNPASTPQLIEQDVKHLKKLPKQLGAILEDKPSYTVGGGLKGLLNDGSEIVCWAVCADIKHVSLFDYNGLLTKNVQEFRKKVHSQLAKYYGPQNIPKFAVNVPHLQEKYNDIDDIDVTEEDEEKKPVIEISLLSASDGRKTIVELLKTLSDLKDNKEIQDSDFTMDLLNNQLLDLVGPEPDLILCFGPRLDLTGYPPWHIRLAEMHWEADNNEVQYAVFIRGLRNYSNAKMNVGK